jgi:hypothetical protein
MKKLLLLASIATLFVSGAFAQSTPVSSTVNVNVLAEAGLTVPTNATLTSTGSLFANYTGSSTFTYYIRTSAGASGSGNIQLSVSSDFTPANGPSVGSSSTTGDTLTYISAPIAPASAPAAQTASTSTATPVASFGPNAHSLKAGTTGNSVNWTLVNDPTYATGSYSAIVTWTISAA